MYDFRETTPYTLPDNPSLPTEAVAIDGKYLDQVIEGFRTLTVSGRELEKQELDTLTIGSIRGSFLRSNHQPSREIIVEYQLLAKDAAAFRAAFHQLNALLSGDSHQVSFNDEPDVYYTVAMSDVDSVPKGRLNVTSTFTLFAFDPYAYSKKLISADAIGGKVTIHNNGNVPAPVQFDIQMRSDNGFIGLVTKENIIQVGNPDEIDGYDYKKNTQLFFNSFESENELQGWSINKYASDYQQHVDRLSGTFHVKSGTNGDWAAMPDYATGTDGNIWYGPSMYRAFSMSPTDWKVELFQHVKVPDHTALGVIEWGVVDATGKMIAGFRIRKIDWADMGLQMYPLLGASDASNGKANIVTTDTWEGPAKTGLIADFWGHMAIQKTGDNYTMSFTNEHAPGGPANWAKTFYRPDLAKIQAAGFNYWTGAAGGFHQLSPELFFVRAWDNSTLWQDSKNMFASGDKLHIETTDELVKSTLNGAPILGSQALGSEPIMAAPGDTDIQVVTSTFATAPSVTASIRERWL
ncbi:MAG: distal tail protein Dit [Schleiferilactobacillus perolens]|uniref:distal tail protein Dit n=1 Tax=Schleiferilactobacillus perolens TaxID=100468 RepID=UPI0039E8B9BC